MNKLQIISSGIVKNNPTFVLVLGINLLGDGLRDLLGAQRSDT